MSPMFLVIGIAIGSALVLAFGTIAMLAAAGRRDKDLEGDA